MDDEIELVEDWRGRMIPVEEWKRRHAWRRKLKRCLEDDATILTLVLFGSAIWGALGALFKP